MIQEYYRQMRKFGCNILAVVQQYDVLRASEARAAIIGNSKMFLKLKSITRPPDEIGDRGRRHFLHREGKAGSVLKEFQHARDHRQ